MQTKSMTFKSREIKTMRAIKQIIILSILGVLLSSCSIRHMALKSAADSLSGQNSSVFASDDDPELVRDAIPFGLKLNEAILQEVPGHKGLLMATASGFTQYAYAFLQLEADLKEDSDQKKADELRDQALKLYLRSRQYAVRALEVDHPAFMAKLRSNPKSALEPMTRKDVPSLYWAGVSWAAAISLSKNDLDMLSELYLVEAVMKRALELNADYDNGALHEFFITFDGSRPDAMGGSIASARDHFSRAVTLTKGAKASPYVSLAENISIRLQDINEFTSLINKALSIDPNAEPGYRLENILSQRRAKWLMMHKEDLFVNTEGSTGSE
jgi:predicted anti-sigma-YlaC factor YlaD